MRAGRNSRDIQTIVGNKLSSECPWTLNNALQQNWIHSQTTTHKNPGQFTKLKVIRRERHFILTRLLILKKKTQNNGTDKQVSRMKKGPSLKINIPDYVQNNKVGIAN